MSPLEFIEYRATLGAENIAQSALAVGANSRGTWIVMFFDRAIAKAQATSGRLARVVGEVNPVAREIFQSVMPAAVTSSGRNAT